MQAEAERILEVFRKRGLHAGGMIPWTEFGDAVIWKDGCVRDASVREGLAYLSKHGYLLEHENALELSEKGSTHVYGSAAPPTHGARVYRFGTNLAVKQTVLRGTPPEYVLDERHERDVSENDDRAIAAAIRDATSGKL